MDINPHIHGHGYIVTHTNLNSKRSQSLQCILIISQSDNRRKSLWGAEIAENPPTVDYNEIVNKETSHKAIGKWTKNIVSDFIS